MNLIIIGHVDSGKSTLAGNMLIKTGMIEPEEIRKYEQEAKANDRESWYSFNFLKHVGCSHM